MGVKVTQDGAPIKCHEHPDQTNWESCVVFDLECLKVKLKQRVSNGLQFLGFRGEIFTTWLNHLDYISWMIQHLKLIT